MSIVATYEQQARATLDPGTLAYFATGSGIEETLATNVEAWQQLMLRPRMFRDVAAVDTTTTLLGTPVAAPVGISPTGFQHLAHADGELATARGADRAGSLFTLATRSLRPLSELGAAAGAWWFQIYILRDRDLTATIVRAAAAAGARALVLTLDVPYVAAKARPTDAALDVGRLVPELTARDDDSTHQSPSVTPPDIAWLREISGGLPVIAKGVLRDDDAKACVDAGADAIWVSNHGGRQLDGAIPSALALPEVVRAVGDRVEVYVDGGVRTGRDVVRALALGARAAFVGRPALWALAADGADGVASLLTGLHAETREAVALTGFTNVHDIEPDIVRTR